MVIKLSDEMREDICGTAAIYVDKVAQLEAEIVALKRGIGYIHNLTTETAIAQTCDILLGESDD